MSPDKPLKLLPESVRTFLEFGLKHIINEQKSTMDSGQKKSSMFKFIKMICVSNSYLICSRCAYFDIYRLNLRFYQYVDKLSISLSFKRYDFSAENTVCLTYDYACKLIQLLFPPYSGAFFLHDVNKSIFEHQFKILKLTKGKIGLYLFGHFNAQFAQEMLKTFVDRIHQLNCSTKFFMYDKRLQLPILNYLFIDSLENFNQFVYILRRKVNGLSFGRIHENVAIKDGNLIESKNETIKTLKLPFGQIDYVKFEKLIEYFCKSCLNLKYLVVKAEFIHSSKFSANQVSDQIIVYAERMNDLKTRLGNNLVSMFIKFELKIFVRYERDRTWINTVRKNSEFSGWKVKSVRKFYESDNLEMSFNDAKRKLELVITVYTYDRNNELVYG